jgi:Protein of unknown function (DUF2934)
MAKARKRTESASVIDQPIPSPDTHTAEGAGGDAADHRDRIATRAYELYLARGGADGADFDDWLAAEREIAAGNGSASPGDADE